MVERGSLVALNIKNEVTSQLARELAGETGESLTTAVTEALRERLERVRRTRPLQPLRDELLALGAACAAHLPEPYRSLPHGDLLYGDDGLPR